MPRSSTGDFGGVEVNTEPKIPLEYSQTLNALCGIVNAWATSKGWNEGEDSIQRKSSDIALMHSELSECLEFLRKGDVDYCPECDSNKVVRLFNGCECEMCGAKFSRDFIKRAPARDDHVPSLTGEAAELADVLIRIFHYCGRRGIALGEAVRLKHEYNLSRPYKHGKSL